MVLSSLVRRHDRSFVVHLLEPAINRCLSGDLCNLVSSKTKIDDFQAAFYGISLSGATEVSQDIINAMVVWKRLCSEQCILLVFANKPNKNDQCHRMWVVLSSLCAKYTLFYKKLLHKKLVLGQPNG